MTIARHWNTARVALVLSAVTLMAAATSWFSPCSIAQAQSGVCSGAVTVSVAGGATINDDGGSAASDDFIVETDTTADAFEVDSSTEVAEFNIPLNLEDELRIGTSAGTANQVLATQGAGSPPQWAELGSIGGPSYRYKSADESDMSGSPQNDDHLFFSVDANSLYAVEMSLKTFDSGSVFMAGDFSVPAGTEWDCSIMWDDSDAGDTEQVQYHSDAGAGFSVDATGHVYFNCVVDTAATSGTFQYRWYGSGSVNWIIEEGSWLSFVKLN